LVLSAPVTAGGRAQTGKFDAWLTDRLRERASIWKQERLYKEELRHGRKDADHDGDAGGKGADSKRKKKKGGSKGGDGKAGAAADA